MRALPFAFVLTMTIIGSSLQPSTLVLDPAARAEIARPTVSEGGDAREATRGPTITIDMVDDWLPIAHQPERGGTWGWHCSEAEREGVEWSSCTVITELHPGEAAPPPAPLLSYL